MKGPARAALVALAVVVLVGAAFWGGTAYEAARSSNAAGAFTADGGRGFPAGGPIANLSAEEQAELQNMTAEERQQWFQENGGDRAAGMGGPLRGGNLEGEVIEVADDTITVSLDTGSQTFYLDDDTVVAYAVGAGALTAGSTVMVIAAPAADGVTAASLVVVK